MHAVFVMSSLPLSISVFPFIHERVSDFFNIQNFTLSYIHEIPETQQHLRERAYISLKYLSLLSLPLFALSIQSAIFSLNKIITLSQLSPAQPSGFRGTQPYLLVPQGCRNFAATLMAVYTPFEFHIPRAYIHMYMYIYRFSCTHIHKGSDITRLVSLALRLYHSQ